MFLIVSGFDSVRQRAWAVQVTGWKRSPWVAWRLPKRNRFRTSEAPVAHSRSGSAGMIHGAKWPSLDGFPLL